MKKILFLFIIFFFFPLFTVSAQQQSERWVCLKADQAGGHEASVSVDPDAKPLASTDTYVFECLSTEACTSGNAAVDQEVFGKNNLQEMAANFGYRFEGTSLASNPVMSDASGVIPTFTWQSSTPQSHARRWLAMNYFEPTSTAETTGAGGEQLGTFDFETALNQSDCVSLSWDPYGRIFDASTLEPVSGASVTLLKERDNGNFTPMTPADLLGGNIRNPQRTEKDGGFSFVVPDGTYKLDVSLGNYDFPVQLSSLQSNYSRIYSDIYPSQTGEEIVQVGAIQHRDIPLSARTGSQNNDVELMEYFQDLDKASMMVYVKGRVSHPFALIKAFSLKPDPVIGQNVRYRLLTDPPVHADALGNFKLEIDQTSFEPDENFGDITVTKVDLRNPANLVEKIKEWFFGLIGQVNAQVILASNYRFEPIPNYLEGYAYDSQGEVIPNAKVSVVLNFSNKPSYQTTADENGFFKIGSEYLPSMPYRVTYTSPTGQTVTTTTSKFIVQNQELIESTGTSINQIKNDQGETITPVEQEPATAISPVKAGGNKITLAGNNTLALLIAIIATLIIIAVIALIYYKKKGM